LNKDNLYCNKADSVERRSCQKALAVILTTMVRLMAPILSFTCEDIYKFIKEVVPGENLLFAQLADFPKVDESLKDTALEEKFNEIFKLRDEIYKVLEEKRAAKEIAASIDARVVLTVEPEKLQGFQAKELEKLLIVSQLEIKSGPLKIEVSKAAGEKCIRCWKYFEELNGDKICARCAEVAG